MVFLYLKESKKEEERETRGKLEARERELSENIHHEPNGGAPLEGVGRGEVDK